MKEVKGIREKGFTLIELMIVIAILAILAAIAANQYGSYKRQAKAKDLISVARNCAGEIAAYCTVQGSSATFSASDFDSCSYSSGDQVGNYLKISSVNLSATSCGSSVTVTAKGYVDDDTSYCYQVECTMDTNYNVQCTTIKKGSGC